MLFSTLYGSESFRCVCILRIWFLKMGGTKVQSVSSKGLYDGWSYRGAMQQNYKSVRNKNLYYPILKLTVMSVRMCHDVL